MKYETFSEYDPRHTALAESAFLTLWSTLGRWHSDLVLVGGLVPKYLCGDDTQQRSLPRPATLDVDLGISLAADSGQYGNLFWELSGQGFKRSEKRPPRLEKTIGDFPIYVDFLVEHPPRTSGSAQVQDITADIMPGVNRALATAREVTVAGVDLHGAEQRLIARVCEVGPFLALKLRAFASRQQPKDAFDILYAILSTTAAPRPPSPPLPRKSASAIPPAPMPSARCANTSPAKLHPAPSKPATLCSEPQRPVNQQTPGSPARPFVRTWWMLLLSCSKPPTHDPCSPPPCAPRFRERTPLQILPKFAISLDGGTVRSTARFPRANGNPRTTSTWTTRNWPDSASPRTSDIEIESTDAKLSRPSGLSGDYLNRNQ
jgi:hypothetical protein